ncbi:5-hydroxytryptamine receptor 7-like [Sinocyclocheilus anshuiensis]|uniref:5-hydroxytryptamine receptor 7-like n=1 Tax=Sinocyclocheilus anshuiensis TaxID=1608454 RepID=UPI0007B95055|nr:PREDICTED: 5-hydroxytryptamine receptor 7-like [Sinocyclocheilus anshuiensis]
MVLGNTNRSAVAQSHGETTKSLMGEERARETGASVEISNGMMISEVLIPRLFKIAHESGEVAVAAGSGSLEMKPSSSPILLEMMEVANGTRCAEQILSYGEVEKVLIGGVLTMLTLITICGNLLVVISVCFVKKLRQPSNYLIVSLALADLSVALAVMPFVSITDLIGGRWIFGKFFCNVFIAMDVMCCTASIMTLCVISIDRYLGITRPLTYPVRQNGWCMAKMVLSVWLLSASITLPPLFGWAQNVNDDRVCLISQDFGYTIYSTAVAFYIPMTVMLVMYYRIYRAAKLSAAKHNITGFPRAGQEEEEDEVEGAEGAEEHVEVDCVTVAIKLQREVEGCARLPRLLRGVGRRSSDRRSISIFKREQKAAATLGIVVGAFTVCWLPFFLLSTARPFICGTECSCVPLWVERTLLWLGYANSLINPFIYAFFNRDLRTTYRSLLSCHYRNINRRLSAAGMHEALHLVERPEVVVSG